MEPELIYSSLPAAHKPILSITTLCYNTGQFVVEGMEALLAQKSDQVEHVILDDGSGDESIAIIMDYAKSKGYPVRLYANTSNCGITESKSRILKLAKGDFIADCADDIFLPGRLAHDLKMIETLPSEAAGFYSLALPFRVNRTGKKEYQQHPIGRIEGEEEQRTLTPTELHERLQKGNFIPAITVCLRREVYQAIPQDTSFFIEDYPMWSNIANSGWEMVYSPIITTLYRKANHSVQQTHSLEVEFDDLRVKLELLKVPLNRANLVTKKRWFRVVCEADKHMVGRLAALCKRTSNNQGLLLLIARLGAPKRARWIFSNLSLKLNFWQHI